MALSDESVGVACGNCGAPLFMATCHHFRGTNHEWTIVGLCMFCQSAIWTGDGCLDCREDE